MPSVEDYHRDDSMLIGRGVRKGCRILDTRRNPPLEGNLFISVTTLGYCLKSVASVRRPNYQFDVKRTVNVTTRWTFRRQPHYNLRK
jgi:hypothetical protein